MENADVFISYSHKDKKFVKRLITDLRSVGIQVWCDSDNIHIGDYLIERISEAIKACKLFIAVVSESYRDSNWCRHEIKLKLSEEVEKGQTRILPIRLDETDPEELLPAKGWADFRNKKEYSDSLRNLRISISYHLDPLLLEEKQKKLENILKQVYVDACYGAVPPKSVIDRFQTFATMNPDSQFVWRALGYIYHFHLGELDKAERYYLRALEIDPDNPSVNRAIGILYMHAGKAKIARKYLKHAKELGYSAAYEWNEYGAAHVEYHHGPYGTGGIPVLFGSTRDSVNRFMKSSSECKDDKRGGDKSAKDK